MKRHYSVGEQQSDSNGLKKAGAHRPKSATLPSGWSVEVDRESGKTFYFNNETNESTWRPPSTSSTNSGSQSDVCLLILHNCTGQYCIFEYFTPALEANYGCLI